MYLKRLINLLLICTFCMSSIHAQLISIKGQVVEQDSKSPIPLVAISISGTEKKTAETDQNGRFLIKNVQAGEYNIIIAKSGYVPLTFKKVIGKNGLDLGKLEMPISLAASKRRRDCSMEKTPCSQKTSQNSAKLL